MKKKQEYKKLNLLLKEYGITKEECYFRTGYQYNIYNYVAIKMELKRRFG